MHRKSNNYLVLFAVVALVSLAVGIVSAAPVTRSITYQGKLTDAAGNPLAGTYSVRFSLYEAATGGTAVASSTQSVTSSAGLFTTPIAFSQEYFDGRALWLGVKVGSDTEMTPRQEIRPVPYALGLRPGAVIMGDASTNPSLKVINTGSDVAGLISGTTGANAPAVFAAAQGPESPAVYALSTNDVGVYGSGKTGAYFTSNQGGTSWYHPLAAVNVSTAFDNNAGVKVNTTGSDSDGIMTETHGYHSYGVDAKTYGEWSVGIESFTSGNNSAAVSAWTFGDNGDGIYAITNGPNSTALIAYTERDNSKGLTVETKGYESPGISVITYGENSRGVDAYSMWGGEGVAGKATYFAGVKGESFDKAGVWGVSTNNVGVYGDTLSGTYGIYTNDKMYAGAGIDAPNVDIAEYMPVSGDVAPGTVLIIGRGGILIPSSTAYDTHVAGIVSTAPGVSLGTKENGNPGEALIAVAGRVPCRVDASNGPIFEGDLLTTSPRPGYAMKAEPTMINGRGFYPDGTVLGKALGTLGSGTGTIDVLVTLQ